MWGSDGACAGGAVCGAAGAGGAVAEVGADRGKCDAVGAGCGADGAGVGAHSCELSAAWGDDGVSRGGGAVEDGAVAGGGDGADEIEATRKRTRRVMDQLSVGERFMLMFGMGVLRRDPVRVEWKGDNAEDQTRRANT